jgi:hypothetical protein
MKVLKITIVLWALIGLYSCSSNTAERKKEYNKTISDLHQDVTREWMTIASRIQKEDSLAETHFTSFSKLNEKILNKIAALDSIEAPKTAEKLKAAMKAQLFYLSDGCKAFRKHFYSSRTAYTKYEINEWLEDNHRSYRNYVSDTEKEQTLFMAVEKEADKKPIF